MIVGEKRILIVLPLTLKAVLPTFCEAHAGIAKLLAAEHQATEIVKQAKDGECSIRVFFTSCAHRAPSLSLHAPHLTYATWFTPLRCTPAICRESDAAKAGQGGGGGGDR